VASVEEVQVRSKPSTRSHLRRWGVRTGPSPLGRGVFAAKPFAEGHPIGQVHGRVIDDSQYGSEYCIELNEQFSLEPRSPFRYLNHSCDPNCTLVHFDLEDTDDECPFEIWVETLRDISVGEQLTIDYGWPPDAAIPCGCGSPVCRGWVVAAEQAHLVERKK
jgi:hypothetical protein